SSQKRHDRRESQHYCVQSDMSEASDVDRTDRNEDSEQSCPKSQSGSAGDDRKHNAFGQQLTEHARSAGTQRRANRDFAPPRIATNQKQVGNVCAGDEQDKSNSATEDQKGRPDFT